jgi:methylmalonyl-CoA/ethylmalonyl-CoA epimerase
LAASPPPGYAEPETVASQKVKVAMLPLQNSAQVELLEATDQESPIAKFVQKRGPGIHHICFRVKNIKSVLEKLKKADVKLINEEPVPGAHHCLVAFVHPSSTGGVLVELSEKMK